MLRLFVLYTALSLTANAAAAAELGALKSGDMRKLVVYEQPLATPELPFVDETELLAVANYGDRLRVTAIAEFAGHDRSLPAEREKLLDD